VSDAIPRQATLGAPLRFEGVGLHSGAPCVMDVLPAAPDEGIFFTLTSGESACVRIDAVAENIVDTSRATVLGRDGVSVSTTEHILSALFGMGVSNAEIRIDGPEIPIGDGSAKAFADAIDAAGIAPQSRPRAVFTVNEPFVVESGERLVAVLPAPAFRVRFVADFPEPIGTEYFSEAVDARVYRDEIAGARTFGYLHEVQALRARGLALGGTLDNALVFAPDGPMQTLRWRNEVVRHKVLDLIGDFALLGAWPRCEIVAIKSGHELHAAATRALRARTAPVPAPTQR
jgi:UDP-3-O-[3-hydroxymyristoyl] N-acetylglucosamine deacetylase